MESAEAVPPLPLPLQTLQRSVGVLQVEVKRTHDGTRLARSRQQGCLKALIPRSIRSAWSEVVILNTSGGIAGGDRLEGAFDCREATSLVVTGQAAERCYRVRAGEAPALMTMGATLAPFSRLEWLPQELILFDGAALERRLQIEMARSSTLLCLESRVFGRRQSGETLASVYFRDWLTLRRDGVLTLVDAFRLTDDVVTASSSPAMTGSAFASTMLVFAAPEMFVASFAAARVSAVRSALQDEDAGASAWNGLLVVRIMGHDAARHRAAVLRVLAELRDGRPLPSVWRC